MTNPSHVYANEGDTGQAREILEEALMIARQVDVTAGLLAYFLRLRFSDSRLLASVPGATAVQSKVPS